MQPSTQWQKYTRARWPWALCKLFWKWASVSLVVGFIILFLFPDILLNFDSNKPSRVFGQVENGRIENSRRIPMRGDNFTTYSFLGYLLGRTHVHEGVRDIVLEAYKTSAQNCPEQVFVLGETGWPNGGHFPPHRTHRNGLSVDFMSPLLKDGEPYRSNHLFNLWGYGYEFDLSGRSGNLEIDYEAMACHILAIKNTAEKKGWSIAKIIFDPMLRPALLGTSIGDKLRNLPFTRNRVSIRHDDHYHIDFRQ